MKKGYIVLIVIAVVVLSIFFWFKGAYNGMVNMREAVSAQWSNVENQYQRRLDLIPNLVNTVKGYASHEENTLTEVVNARAKATQMQLNIDQLDEATLKKLSNVQGELSSALSRLMAISENYPDLKANQTFLICKPSSKERKPDSSRTPEIQRCRPQLQCFHPAIPQKPGSRNVRIHLQTLF